MNRNYIYSMGQKASTMWLRADLTHITLIPLDVCAAITQKGNIFEVTQTVLSKDLHQISIT